jgi:putative cell wall-binding protein
VNGRRRLSRARGAVGAVTAVLAMLVAAVAGTASASGLPTDRPAARAAVSKTACAPATIGPQQSDAILLPVSDSGSISKVTFALAWSGPANADLVLGLQSPGEAAAALAVAAPGTGGAVTFADSGAAQPATGSGLSGTLKPLEPFSVFTGTPSTGEWSLLILNLSADTALTVSSCSLALTVEGSAGGWSPAVDRVAGADRYEAAVNVSKAAFATTAPVVYVVTGANYPDALSAGPAAAAEQGPLLLTPSDALPARVKAEIIRLKPKKIVVVGGVNSVSAAVLAQLKTIQPNTVRIGGADRYEASRNLAEYAFGKTGAATAYVATGTNFPDALSAGSAAASTSGPVVLVNGPARTVDAPTKALLGSLGVSRIVIAGGPNSVTPAIETALSKIASTTRQGGADRFAASVAINTDAFTSSRRALLVTGLKFPDALSGSAWGGELGAPLYVATADCVPAATLAAMEAQGVERITLIGGTASLGPSVAALKPC